MFRRGGRLMPLSRRALVILPLWISCIIWMWSWWFSADYDKFWPLFIPLTLALLYEFALLPSAFLYFVLRARKPKLKLAPKHKKVAVISLCVPKYESIDVVERQLQAMANIKYPHDSWILDEGNNKQIKALAKKYGVRHFSRKGTKKYNQPIPPFQKKTKAGNVNAWIDHVKRRKYDYFVQLDIDHIPKENYLNKTLGYFKDTSVAWVQAPSVYKNLGPWTARGAAEQELVLQGPLQMGFYGHSETPFIIGSHCTYRMSAINEIGGFQPTRAEDHLDTVYLANKGYKGIFLPEIIAEGDGPETLNTYLAQQYAWAYSMFQVLLNHTPKALKAMPWKKRLQFLFAQTWYPLWSLSYLTMFITPVAALFLNTDVAEVDARQMVAHFIPMYVCSYLVWWSARPLMQPKGLGLTWRGIILHAVRWPIILRAIIAALFKIKKSYMITPKGRYAQMAPTLQTYRPFLLLGLLCAGAVSITSAFANGNLPQAQILYAIINAVFMLTICWIDLSLRFKQAKPKMKQLKQYWLKPIVATASLAVLLSAAVITSGLAINHSRAIALNDSSAKALAVRPVTYEMSTDELVQQIKLAKVPNQDAPKLGMYNPAFELPESKEAYVQHSFSDWRDDHYFTFALAKSVQAGNTPLITLEPRGDADGTQLLSDIVAGKHDDKLQKLTTSIKASRSPVYIRFGHEMELGNLYPWGNQDPDLYIEAYRHIADYTRHHGANNVRFVWSPAGNPGAEAYYPGDEYVDAIGTTILYDEYWYGATLPSFSQLSAGRQWLQQYNKPVWIVEFGAGTSNKSNQAALIGQAIEEYESLGFEKLIYLNLIDANIVGPDYRLSDPNDFGEFFVKP